MAKHPFLSDEWFEIVEQLGAWGEEYTPGRLLDVKVLRNRLHEIGHRTTRYGQGHAIEIECAVTAEVAGNILDRLYDRLTDLALKALNAPSTKVRSASCQPRR